MDGAMSLASGQMLMWFHFTPGDNLWFQGWVPSSAGAMAGTCVGLFLLAVVDRWIGACRGVMEMHWARRYVFHFVSFLRRAILMCVMVEHKS